MPSFDAGRMGWSERLFVVSVLAVFAALAVLSMREKNPTFDETAHLAAGLSYVQTGDFRMNPEHPVLPKLLAGASATLTGARISTDSRAWRRTEQWDFGREALYESGVGWREIVFAGRLPMVGLLIHHASIRLYGGTGTVNASAIIVYPSRLRVASESPLYLDVV